MREVRDKRSIHIDITNACRFSCANCYKFVGHYNQPYFMELTTVRKAIDSLEGFQGTICITGGEPTLHPDFVEICKYLRKKVPLDLRSLQTTGYKWREYNSVIRKTFAGLVMYNDHKDVTEKHQPMLVAIKDVIADDSFRRELIGKCWVRERWSAVINTKGCFYCEIAAAFDLLQNGPGGHPIKKGWWKKGHEHFNQEMERYCNQCGAALPQQAVTLRNRQDHVSISNFRVLEKLNTPKFQKNRVLLVDKNYSVQDVKKIAVNWYPDRHLGEGVTKKHILQRYGLMNSIFLSGRLALQYTNCKLRKAKRLAGRLFSGLTQKII